MSASNQLVADTMAVLGVVESYLRQAKGNISFSYSLEPGKIVKTTVLDEIARIMLEHEDELKKISDEIEAEAKKEGVIV